MDEQTIEEADVAAGDELTNEPVDLVPTVETTTDEAGEELTDLDLIKRALLEGDVSLELDPSAMMRAIVERVLEAPAGDVFKADDVRHAKDLIGRPLRVRGVRWFPSAFDEGPSVFATVDAAILDTGEICVVTVGAARALAQLFRAQRDDLFPITVRVVEALRATAAGYYPYHLEQVEDAPPERG